MSSANNIEAFMEFKSWLPPSADITGQIKGGFGEIILEVTGLGLTYRPICQFCLNKKVNNLTLGDMFY